MRYKNIYIAVCVIIGAEQALSLYGISKTLMSGTAAYLGLFYYLNILTEFFNTAALIVFIASKFKKDLLFRFSLCMMLVLLPTILLQIYFYFKAPEGMVTNIYLLGCLFYLLKIIAAATALFLLTKRRGPLLIHINGGTIPTAEFAPANAGKRVLNYLTDLLLFIWALYSFVQFMSFTIRYFPDLFDFLKEYSYNYNSYYFLTPILLIYYLFFEGIFNTTAGKCLTNTVIVNDYGEPPGFLRRIARAFCRLIPFDAFSFFGSGVRGWHDSIPNTYVVNAAENEVTNEEDKMLEDFLNMEVLPG